MAKIDLAYALSGKERDPFHVPGKESEMVSFVCAGLLAAVLIAALFLMPSTVTNVTIMLGLAGFFFLNLVRGIRQRQFRLQRAKEVARLRSKL